ncbi:MAG: biotin--[acetyl-CoA-carboxylase] ligase, partial [Nanoarchaeota archaeon]|nr:biotin--[acetyl-CoA-carboxylase] ligase [Nanoarchaeota archaeon]
MFKVYHFKRLLSTNEKAKEFKINSVVIADEQRFGKGRFSRRWSSGKGGVYLSLVLDADDVKIQYFTFVAAISVQKAIKDVYGIKSVIKWPNDLIYTNKKICGILTNSNNKKTIVGVGINTNNTIPKSLIKKGISLKKIINKKINNKIIINKILE